MVNRTVRKKIRENQTDKPEDFPIDIVYTWVDQSDPLWLDKRAKNYSCLKNKKEFSPCLDSIREKEFESINQLKFSLRSVSKHAKFVRKIFIVTDEQIPAWLNMENPKIKIISHKAIFGDSGTLPCFNSHAIESRLHHIPGLAEHFLYLNDDFFLGRDVHPNDFFRDKDISKFFLSPRKIDPSPVSSHDLGISSAAKQGRILLKKFFGKTAFRHILHAPYPLRRSILFEMEKKLKPNFQTTKKHQFRHQKDQSIAALLFFYYANFTGRAVPEKIKHMYLDNNLQHIFRKLFFSLFGGGYQAFCINGGHILRPDLHIRTKILQLFLILCFPRRCEFEIKQENKGRFFPEMA